MTRKDYVLIAAAIKQTVEDMEPLSVAAQAALIGVSLNIAIELVHDNPRFDRARFLDAAGVQS